MSKQTVEIARTPVQVRERSGRTPDEILARDTARTMSQQKVEIVPLDGGAAAGSLGRWAV